MGFNLGTSSNTGKLHMTDFLKSDNAVQNAEKEIPMETLIKCTRKAKSMV